MEAPERRQAKRIAPLYRRGGKGKGMETNLAYEFEEGRLSEIIGGKVVMMASPSLNHNRVAGNIYNLFSNYLQDRPCEPFQDGASLFLEEGAEEYRPDMMVVCDPEKCQLDGVHGAPDFVLEVLSPGTMRNDRGRKKDMYEKHGVREYWIVSPAEQYVFEDGRFVLRGAYSRYPAFMLKRMTDREKAELAAEFPCALFDDLTVRLDAVFKRVVPVM